MSEVQPETKGTATVRLVNDTVLEMVCVGYGERANFIAALNEMTALCLQHPKISGLLFTATDLRGYDPSNTALAIKWVARHPQIRRGGVVTRSQVIAALTHVGRVMIPGLDAQSFRTRADALTWFATPLTGRPRSRSNRHKAA